MSEKEFYKFTDQYIGLYNEFVIKEFKKAKGHASLLKFDELTVFDTTKDLYAILYAKFREYMLSLALLVYEQQGGDGKKPNRGWIDEFLAAISVVSGYSFKSETNRKRDRTAETIVSSKDKNKAYKKAMLYWSRQTNQEAIEVTDAAAMKAWKDQGIKKVRWVTERDEKVCDDCKPMDGKIFPIDKAPGKKHINCRCHYEPVREGKPR